MVRTRFAPSPTGDLHIGGVRTALFSWLFARHSEGKFILRVEDTDQARSTPQSMQTILEGLDWLGLNYDEGPYFQSQRASHYQAALNKLLDTGHAYLCACSTDRLESLRNEQLARQQKPRYDGHCRHHPVAYSTDTPVVIRFKNPTTGIVNVEDRVLGPVSFQNTELDDFILARSDGTPTYNFTVVVDDFDLEITHVIRGNDHLNNTPRQINVLKALGAPIPVYMHLPMIHSAKGEKLSKRKGADNIMTYKAMGLLPDAVLNYLARLGWSHGDQELFSRDELISYFDGHHLSKSPSMCDTNKLMWLNQQHQKHSDPSILVDFLKPFTQEWQWDGHPKASLVDIVLIQRERTKTLVEMAEKSRFFYETPKNTLQSLESEGFEALYDLYIALVQLEVWESDLIHEKLQYVVHQHQIKMNQLFKPLRMLLAGATISPPMDITIKLLGKSRVLARFKSYFSSNEGAIAQLGERLHGM